MRLALVIILLLAACSAKEYHCNVGAMGDDVEQRYGVQCMVTVLRF